MSLAILNFRILQLEHFTHIYPSYGRKLQKNFYYSSENRGFLFLKSLHMTFIEPNIDEGCRIFHRFNGNPSQDFLQLTDCIISSKFFMIKTSNYLTIKPGGSLSSL